nr:unnamed protein product [Spirometra erinaceieuropaei]
MKHATSVLLVAAFGSILFAAEGVVFGDKSKPPTFASPDDYGYRYCASWQLPDGTPLYSGCDPYSMERCGEKLEFSYKCCSGFEPSPIPLGGPSNKPCGQVIPQFDDCPAVLESMGFSRMAEHLRKIPQLNQRNGQPFTIFAPLPADGSDLEKIYSGNSAAVGYHVVKGRHYADSLKNGMQLESIYQNQKLDIHRSPYGAVSVECAELSQADIECQSGLIHIIRQPLTPRRGLGNLDKTSLMSLLRSNSETREFANDLPPDFQRDLDVTGGSEMYTVTAPSARSWSEMKRGKTPEMIQQIAASHVSKGRKCSSALYKSSQRMQRVNGQTSTVECSVDNKQEVRKIKDSCGNTHAFTETDKTAGNGVLHMLDSPVLPSSALTLKDFLDRPECAKEHNIDKFINDLKDCDLYMNDADQYAVIAPENSAFDWWKNYHQFKKEYERYQTDKEYRCRVARYHIIKHDGNLKNIEQFSGHTDGHRTNNKFDELYETTYVTKDKMGSKLNFHYSTTNNFDSIPLKDTSIYKTSRINVIPEMTVSEVVNSTPELSHAANTMKIADAENKITKPNKPKNLFLVTENEGWLDPRSKALGKDLLSPELAAFESSPDRAEKYTLLNHVPLYLWGGDIGYFEKNTVHRFRSSAGVDLIFWMNDKNEMRIGYDGLPRDEWPKVVKFNLHAKDGMVWVLDRILKCPPHICPLQLEDTDIYTFFTAACITSDLPGETDVKVGFSNQPTEIARRHPEKCLVIKQGEVRTTKDLFEAGPMTDHDH